MHRSLRALMPLRRIRARCAHNRAEVIENVKISHPYNNIPPAIVDKMHHQLHLKKNHPLGIIKSKIESFCNSYADANHQSLFVKYDDLSPIVDTLSCFDDLNVEPTHVSRRPSDTYYINNNELLRTHTSAHQTKYIASGTDAFLCTGDVYRRDEIDSSHYPIFHQMEGVRVFNDTDYYNALIKYKSRIGTELELLYESDMKVFADFDFSNFKEEDVKSFTKEQKDLLIKYDLKELLFGLCKHLFGNEIQIRWREDFFPFTSPSFEIDVLFDATTNPSEKDGKWLEVLGCGVIHSDVIAKCMERASVANVTINDNGWAFGLGLERLAMILFTIPDIRLFWSQDERFTKQFQEGKIHTFQPYSKYPVCYKDVSFWLPTTTGDIEFHSNEVYEIVRNIAGDLVETVRLIDEFTHPKTGKSSHAYRIEYRSMDRSLTNEEVDIIQSNVRDKLVEILNVELR